MWRKFFGRKKSEPAQDIHITQTAWSKPAPFPADPPVETPKPSAALLPPGWKYDNRSYFSTFSALAESAQRNVRRKAALDMGSVYWNRRQYLPILIRLASDPDHHVRVAALRAMTHLDEGELPIILKALSDKKLGVRMEAVRALRYYSTVGAQLVEILDGPDRELHGLAAAALELQTAEEAVPALIRATKESYTTLTRRKAARALGMRHDVRGIAPLLEGIGDVNPNIRAAMARWLRVLVRRLHARHSAEAIATLKSGLSHNSSIVQLHAAYNLAMLGDPSGVAVLTNSLRDVERSPYLTKAQITEALNRLKG